MQLGFKNITLVDASEGMLNSAKSKLKDHKVNFKQMFLPKLLLDDLSFDVVCFIQVLHHIDSPDENKLVLQKEDYPDFIEVVKESYRVLKPGGVIVIDTMFEENIESFWWTSVCPISTSAMKRLRMKKDDILDLLDENSFGNVVTHSHPNGCLMKREIYDDIGKISDSRWRGYLSQFKLVETFGELQQLVNVVEQKKEAGKLDEFLYDCNEKLRIYGHHSTVFAQKPLDS